MALAPSLTWLFVGRVISGITWASVSAAFAYIADMTPPERRAGAGEIAGGAVHAGLSVIGAGTIDRGADTGGSAGSLERGLIVWRSKPALQVKPTDVCSRRKFRHPIVMAARRPMTPDRTSSCSSSGSKFKMLVKKSTMQVIGEKLESQSSLLRRWDRERDQMLRYGDCKNPLSHQHS